MKLSRRPFTCAQCLVSRDATPIDSALKEGLLNPQRSVNAPRAVIDIKHIRQNPDLYERNCLERNYKQQAAYPDRINALHTQFLDRQVSARTLRERSNLLRRQLSNPVSTTEDDTPAIKALRELPRDAILAEARELKAKLASIEAEEERLTTEIAELAEALPNLTSEWTPRGDEPKVLSYIGDHPDEHPDASDRVWRSHVHIGAELGVLDFAAGATTSGWGWYYLVGAAAQLEQALVSYALETARRTGWTQVSPPSMVYGHIASACGFKPRDVNGEQQIYGIKQSEEDQSRGKPELVMAGTAEIPLAGMKADAQIEEVELPAKRVAVSRCYRAEAGARGVDTKGLYRVHEFTKVEMFAWSSPDMESVGEVFDELVDLQTELLQGLGLHCRILEMPSTDLGASAYRKIDIEAYFPSRKDRNEGWGEVTSASVCTDYQTRRLATRTRVAGKMTYPWTVNGTAMAVPRVLAAIFENGWNEDELTVTIPEVLRPWMDGQDKIGPPTRRR
ncbi:Serine--tRNA ligase, mitochondrial [Coniochaeta pulveracea]|uniref:serine--tRNA ligase n=1 Tax=Coniochaeta pulveracea TaxID=177199 RepID=A0A420Y7Y4_9PEZI|nr:Serine--tRNA ligase, mitochondrial [Coniochaeta pulveracea]